MSRQASNILIGILITQPLYQAGHANIFEQLLIVQTIPPILQSSLFISN